MAKKYKQRKNNGNPDAAAHRQRQKEYRMRKIVGGWKEVKVWAASEENAAAIKAFARSLNKMED